MTDHIDLDEMDVDSDDEPDANPGDWFWRGEGDPEDEPDDPRLDGASGSGHAVDEEQEDEDTDDESARDHDPLPGVPRTDRDGPVGIPVEGGGAGGSAPGDQGTGTTGGDPAAGEGSVSAESGATTETRNTASGPHGGGVDDMTMALTYDAAQRLSDPRFAIIEAKRWSDWVGIVGDVPAHAINKFQRDHGIDADFFSGAGQEPAERLADVDEHSMFYAERMVLVGLDGDEPIADRAGWEFVHLETAAEKAGWDLDTEA
jgi:hypothetical protein